MPERPDGRSFIEHAGKPGDRRAAFRDGPVVNAARFDRVAILAAVGEIVLDTVLIGDRTNQRPASKKWIIAEQHLGPDFLDGVGCDA